MKFKKWYGVVALFLLATMLAPALTLQAKDGAQPVRQEIGTNLLVNPGFEGIGKPVDNAYENYGNWTRDTFNGAQYGEIFTPEGWVTWWEEGEYGRPECKVIPAQYPFVGSSNPVRIYQGYYSWFCFDFHRRQHAGLYQVVRNIPPNSVVEGSFVAHAWTCGDDQPALSCGDPNSFYFRVGIDPNGGTDPFSANIVWSAPHYNYDTFAAVGPVQATVGAGGVATLFLEALGKWPNKHNDSYWDNPSLKLVTTGTPPTATPPPPPPTPDPSQPTATPEPPRATSTPLPGGSVIHTVVEGDTLFGIAITYGVDLDELRRLNAETLAPNDMLSIGQEIVVKAGAGDQPTATPEVVQPPVAPVTPTVQPGSPDVGVPAGDKGVICVLAFNDSNGDMFRQSESGEMALPNVEITVVGTGGALTPYRTDGISEPYCFQDLAAGQQYIVRHTPPPGYKTEVGPWNLIVSGGQVYNVELAYTRDQGAAPSAGSTVSPDIKTTPSAEEEPAKEAKEGGEMTDILNLILRISGGIVLLLAVVIVVLFFVSRRV